MRGFLRILLNAATVASLVLFVATVALWVRSHWRAESFQWSGHDPANGPAWIVDVGWSRGEFSVVRMRPPPGHPERYAGLLRPPGHPFRSVGVDDPAGRRYLAGLKPFYHEAWRWGGGAANHRLVVSLWLAFACAAILPAVREGVGFRRRRKAGTGLCPACGYDLRATPERCPECGTIPAR